MKDIYFKINMSVRTLNLTADRKSAENMNFTDKSDLPILSDRVPLTSNSEDLESLKF
jgi:hypothetical protein